MAKRIIPIIYKVDYSQLDKSTEAVKKAEKATDQLNKEIKETETQSAKSFSSIKNAILSTGIIAILATVGKRIFDIGVAAEQTRIAFNTFLGSADRGKKLLADLTKFSIVTPFTPDQVNRAAKALLAFGVQADKIIPTLKTLGDVSSGTGKDLAEMAVIFGQIRSTGRLMGQDLLQLINAGFNPLQIISEKTGKSVSSLKESMEKGLITFDMVEQAFKDATSAGGLFFNLMEKQSETVGGKLSTVAGNIEEMAKQAFEASHGPLSDLLNVIVDITTALAETEEQTLSSQGINKTIIEKIFGSMDKMAKDHEGTKRFLNDITSLYNLAVTEIGKFGREGIALEFMTEQVQSAAELRGITVSLSEAQETANRIYDAAIDTYNENVIARNKVTQSAIDQREAQNAAILAEIEEEKRLRELTEAQKKLREAIDQRKKALELLMGVGRKFAKDIEEGNKEADEKEEKRKSEANDRSLKNQEFFDDLKKKKQKEQQDFEFEQAEAHAERMRMIQETAFEFGVDLIGGLLLATTDSYNQENEALRAKYDEQLLLAGDNERAKAQIELQRSRDEKKLRDKQLQDERNQQVRRILIETVLNAVKALGLPPIPGANYIAAAKATAYGLLGAGLARRYAKGVIDIDGPGSTTSDSIPARLSKHESVMTAEETLSSKGILKAIRAKKLDDRLLDKLSRGSRMGSDGLAFSDARIVGELKRLRPDDLVKKGSYLYDVKTSNSGSVKFIRRKYIH